MIINDLPRVSIVIPSWTGEVTRLKESIQRQTFQDFEIEIVQGTSPAARARNIGASRTKAAIIVFIDDDAYFGSDSALEKLVNLIESDPQIGAVGSSKLVPPEADSTSKAIGEQVPRMIYPILNEDLESNPPLEGSGFTAITTTCCAIRRQAFEAVGGFDENLSTGEDTDFFYQMRRKGYRIFVAANCWVYHDPPANLKMLVRKSFHYGRGYALEVRKNPQRIMAIVPLDRWYSPLLLLVLTLALPISFFVHYYFDPVRKLVIDFRPYKTISTYAVLYGYSYGWYFGQRHNPTQAKTYLGRKKAS